MPASDEDGLEPDLEIIDAHHHLWPATTGGRWDPYSLADFECDARSGHRVVGSVYVECGAVYREQGSDRMRPVGETEAVAGLNVAGGLCKAIVGFADLTLGADVADVLDAHIAVAGVRLRGIRHTVAWDPDPTVYATARRTKPGMLRDRRFQAGVAELSARGLAFETWLYFHQLSELAEFADAHPDLSVILDHLGGPAATGRHADARAEVLRAWRSGMVGVSHRPNVFVKLGAVGMPAFSGPQLFARQKVTSRDIADYWGQEIRFCIDTFGAGRCMFESNFPVDRALCDYRTLWDAFKQIAAPYARAEKELLFAGTARSAYGLAGEQTTDDVSPRET